MSRYRKIDVRIWNDEKFRDLSDAGQLAFLFVLTHPSMTALGAMRATMAGLAAEKRWTPEAFTEAFGEALAKGMLEHEERAACVAVPNFLRYNPPENPNVVKAWASSLDLIPEGSLKILTIQRAKAFLKGRTKAFAEALPKAFAEALPEGAPKRMPKQEQEPEQEPEQEQHLLGSGGEGLAQGREGFDFPYTPPDDPDACRFWLEGEGVHPSQMGDALKLAMGHRLYADRLDAMKRPKEANAYAEAKGRAA
ncbi:MAG: hypothetical protein KL801_09405 [Mesorhizobium sp.]|nr:hypothetical protein [Mesorhizobium sp.]